MFKRILKWIGAIILVGLVVLAIFLINPIWFRPWSLNLFYDKVFAEVIFSEPELLTSLGLVEQFGFTSHNGKFSDESPAHQQIQIDRWKKDLEQLHEYPLDKQTPSQKLSTHVLDWFLKDQVEGEKWQFHNYPVNQLFGVQNQYPEFMANTHRLFSQQDCQYYIMRLDALPTKFDQTLEGLKLREQRQIIPPRFVVEEVLKEMADFIAKPPAENILATSFKERAAKINKLTDQQRADFQKHVEAEIASQVYPAYQKLIAYFQELLPKTTTEDGVWKLPDGDAFYAYVLRSNTTTNMPPNDVHELGLREVTRIEAEMRALLDANGFAGQPIPAAIDKLGKDPRFLYSNDDKGRAEALAEYKRLIDRAVEESKAHLFYIAPKAQIDIRRVEPFKEVTAPGAYYQGGAMDGSRPGIFYANLRDMNEAPKWSMPTLAYHEGVPGHHWQISIAQELKGLPQFRKVIPFTAYAEGWALYCEWLAKQAGWYDKDPFGDLGRLRDELFRAVRLVVDTGIHAKHWTRERAITYMRDKTGMGEKEAKSGTERQVVNPGQACAYKVGMLKIQELRSRAQQELGDKFDQREFDDTVLKNGSLPLEILEEQVNDYIQKKKA